MTSHDRRDFSLHTPMIINTTLSCLSSAFWALYAWLFDPKTPNYFMVSDHPVTVIDKILANSLAAAMNLIQIVWLLIPRNCHREVVGQIADVESLRSVLLSVARSLERLGAAAPTEEFLTQTKYLLRLKKGMSIGWQSLAVMEIAFIQMEENLREKVTVTAAALAAAQGFKKSTSQDLLTNVQVMRSLHEECKVSKEAFGEIQREIKNKIANVPGSGENLQINIKATAERTRNLARSVRANMETINGQEGIFPPTMKIAFNFCTEQILAVKSSADAPFLWLGFGGFALRRRLKLSFDKVNWPAVPFLGY
uniref:Uncharacterized protein n=1 Tax=Oryza punctata TaxID=4537 RepID=A0A0E0M4M9_ORYPU